MVTKVKIYSVLVFVALCLGGIFGCQLDVSGGVGAKALYPDNLGEHKVGDPRRPMYEGSGYAERHTAGGETRVLRPGEKPWPTKVSEEGGAQ